MANWPTSISTDANLLKVVNFPNGNTVLSSPIDSLVVTIPLLSVVGFPSSQTGYVTIGEEVIFFGGISGNNLVFCVRGADGTVTASHLANSPVNLTYVAAHHNLLKDEIIAIETSLNFTPNKSVFTDNNGRLVTGDPITNADQHLSNLLSPTSINQHLYPSISNTFDLGILGMGNPRWRSLNTRDVNLTGDILMQENSGKIYLTDNLAAAQIFYDHLGGNRVLHILKTNDGGSSFIDIGEPATIEIHTSAYAPWLRLSNNLFAGASQGAGISFPSYGFAWELDIQGVSGQTPMLLYDIGAATLKRVLPIVFKDPLAFDSSLIPSADGSFSLGTSSFEWLDAFIKNSVTFPVDGSLQWTDNRFSLTKLSSAGNPMILQNADTGGIYIKSGAFNSISSTLIRLQVNDSSGGPRAFFDVGAGSLGYFHFGLDNGGQAGQIMQLDSDQTPGNTPMILYDSSSSSLKRVLPIVFKDVLSFDSSLIPSIDATDDLGSSAKNWNSVHTSAVTIKEGSDATMGVATLSSGTVTIPTNKVTANSRIFLTVQSLGTIVSPVAIAVSARTPGTDFTVLSADLTDTSVVAWTIIEPS